MSCVWTQVHRIWFHFLIWLRFLANFICITLRKQLEFSGTLEFTGTPLCYIALKSESCSGMSDSSTPCTVACQAPLSMEFSRPKYWSGLPCSPPGESSWPRDQTQVSCLSCIGRWVLYHQHHLGILKFKCYFSLLVFLGMSSGATISLFSF